MSDNKEQNINLGIEKLDNNSGGADDMSSFFAELDKAVNGAVFEGSGEGDNKPKDDNKLEEPKTEEGGESKSSDEVADLKKELESLKSRYESSSAEAKRLSEKLQEVERYEPLIDAMRRDPVLTSNVKGYLEQDSGSRPLKDRLNLPEDFVFDFDEAISNPQSDSARVFSEMARVQSEQVVGGALRERQAQEEATQAKRQNEQAIVEFQSKYELDDGQMKELIDWASKKSLSYEDIWYLKNRKNRDQEIVKKTAEERERQKAKMSQKAGSLGGVGSSKSTETTPEDEIFKHIQNAIEGANIFQLNKG